MTKHRLIIGADLSGSRPEICYYDKTTKQSAALPMKIGNYNVTLTELFEKSAGDEESSRTVADLFREVFRTFGIEEIPREIVGMTVTFPKVDAKMVRMIRRAFELLEIPRSRTYVQDYSESFYSYMAYQKKELWNRGAALFAFEKNRVQFFRFASGTARHSLLIRVGSLDSCDLPQDPEQKDHTFAEYVRSSIGDGIYSSVFITGEGFDESWADESKRILCAKGRRVFTEDSVFVKGACNAARERFDEKKLTGVKCLSDSIVPYNIGMDMIVGGKMAYYPLITGGSHWYNTTCDCEFLLGSKKELEFQVSGVETGGRYSAVMKLDGLPDRPGGTTRLRLHMEFTGERVCTAEVTDLGFGELFPASGKTWKEELGDVR